MSENKTILPKVSESDKNRFWSKVGLTANPNLCWNWTASSRRNGYGRISITVAPQKDVSVIAPRMAYFLHYGVDPKEKCVLHKCDNPKCCNPSHLFLGTNKDNTDDMMKKKRGIHPQGSHHGRSVLTEKSVIIIRDKKLKGVSIKDLAKEYNISESAINLVVNKKTWKHIL